MQQHSSGIFSAAAKPPADHELIDERALSKLRWRCRRGFLENDLLLERFFSRYESELTVRHAKALAELMDLSDNDLLDLLLARKSPKETDAALDRADVNEVLTMLKGQP